MRSVVTVEGRVEGEREEERREWSGEDGKEDWVRGGRSDNV